MSLTKQSLDKDLEKLVHVEAATRTAAGGIVSHGTALVFLGISALIASIYSGITADTAMVIFAAILGGYMALNIGANDVANNVGPAVGSRALTMVGALVIAAVFESAGALLAGGDVVATISKGIIDPSQVADTEIFVWAMMAALISAALARHSSPSRTTLPWATLSLTRGSLSVSLTDPLLARFRRHQALTSPLSGLRQLASNRPMPQSSTWIQQPWARTLALLLS